MIVMSKKTKKTKASNVDELVFCADCGSPTFKSAAIEKDGKYYCSKEEVES